MVMISVALRIGSLISLAAPRIRGSVARRSPGGRRRLSRSRRWTFSTKMIASSTRAPIAMAIPPSVMVFTVPPRARIVMTASASDRGMATTEISVVRTFHRKSSRMAITKNAPSRSAMMTFSTASEMKSAWRKMSRSKVIPSGSSASIRSSSASTRSVSSSVLAPACFWTDRMTAGSRSRIRTRR